MPDAVKQEEATKVEINCINICSVSTSLQAHQQESYGGQNRNELSK